MNLDVVWRIGSSRTLMTATLALGFALGRWLRVAGDTPLLVSVGTAICGGSAIAGSPGRHLPRSPIQSC